jgi:hypothetical protein
LGPIVALGYFEKDAKAAREVEKLMVKEGLGSPGRRGWRGGATALKRTFLAWALSEIGDPKSEKFVREKVLGAQNENDPFAGVVMQFYDACARKIAGKPEAAEEVERGVEGAISFGGGNPVRDDARKGREDVGFTPKGEWASAGGRPRGGGGGDGGGAPGNGGKG